MPYGGAAASALAPAMHRPASSPPTSSHHSSVGGEGGSEGMRSSRSSYSGGVYEPSSSRQAQQQPRMPMSVPKAAAALLAGPKLWSEKVGVGVGPGAAMGACGIAAGARSTSHLWCVQHAAMAPRIACVCWGGKVLGTASESATIRAALDTCVCERTTKPSSIRVQGDLLHTYGASS